MMKYLPLICLLVLAFAPSAEAAYIDTPPGMVGMQICGTLRGQDGDTAVRNGTSTSDCETLQANDKVQKSDYAWYDGSTRSYYGMQRSHVYNRSYFMSIGVFEYTSTPSGGGATTTTMTPTTEVGIFRNSAMDKPECPIPGKRQDGTIGPTINTGHPDFWSSAQGPADMTTLCGLTATSCNPGEACRPASMTPVGGAKPTTPVANPIPTTCAPIKASVGAVTIKAEAVGCFSARTVMAKYLKTGNEPAGYLCVRLASKRTATAKCRGDSSTRTKSPTIVGTWKR